MECGTNNCHWKQLQFVQCYGHNIRHNIRRFCQCNAQVVPAVYGGLALGVFLHVPLQGQKISIAKSIMSGQMSKVPTIGILHATVSTLPLRLSVQEFANDLSTSGDYICVIMVYLLMFCFKFSIYHCHGPKRHQIQWPNL